MEVKTNGKCIVCGGEIIGLIEKEFDPRSGPLIIGPGSKMQHHDVHKGYHCKNCGLKYEFIPQIKEQEESKESSEGKKICPKCGNEMRKCRLAVGGFPGHPHIHPSGPLGYECSKCGHKEKGEA